MKRILVVIILICCSLILGYTLYNQSEIPLSQIEEVQKSVVLLTKMKYGDYWETVVQGAEAAEKEFGIHLIYDAPHEEDDVDGQIALMEKYIEDGVDGIVLAASDYEALVPVVEKAYDNGIRVVLIDAQVNTEKYHKSFSTNNFEAGKQVGYQLVELLDKKGRVGVVSFVKGSENAIQREKGLYTALSAYEAIEVVDVTYCMSSIELAETLAMVYLDQEVDAVIGLNAIAATGVGRALTRDTSVIGIGFDSTKEEITLMDQGFLDATIVQNPYGMGYLGVKYAAIDDEDYEEKDNLIDTFVITPENMFLKENQKLVFPFNVE